MPKYIYNCTTCESHFEVYHGMSEEQETCSLCDSKYIHRVPQMTFYKRPAESKGDKVGEKTKAAIEANREVLKDMKKQASKDYYRDDN